DEGAVGALEIDDQVGVRVELEAGVVPGYGIIVDADVAVGAAANGERTVAQVVAGAQAGSRRVNVDEASVAVAGEDRPAVRYHSSQVVDRVLHAGLAPSSLPF